MSLSLLELGSKLSATNIGARIDDALIQQSTILNLPGPQRYDLDEIQSFLDNISDEGALTLKGDDKDVWGSVAFPKEHSHDLVTLRPRAKEDAFSGWVAKNAMDILLRCGARRKKPHRIHQVITLNDRSIFRFTYWVMTIVAPLIPITSIAVLYRVRSTSARLAIIGVFNIIMSVCLKTFTNAKRAEVFAITCA